MLQHNRRLPVACSPGANGCFPAHERQLPGHLEGRNGSMTRLIVVGGTQRNGPFIERGVFEVIPQGAPTCGAFIGDVRVSNPAGGLRSAQIGNSGDLWVFFILDDIFRSQRDDDFCMVSLWVTPSNLIATAAIDFSRTQWSVRVAQWPRPGLARPTCRRVWQAGSLHIFR